MCTEEKGFINIFCKIFQYHTIISSFRQEKRRRQKPPSWVTFCGRTCSQYTDPWQDSARACQPGSDPGSRNFRNRSGKHTAERCIRCTYLPYHAWCFSSFDLGSELVCPARRKKYGKIFDFLAISVYAWYDNKK